MVYVGREECVLGVERRVIGGFFVKLDFQARPPKNSINLDGSISIHAQPRRPARPPSGAVSARVPFCSRRQRSVHNVRSARPPIDRAALPARGCAF